MRSWLKCSSVGLSKPSKSGPTLAVQSQPPPSPLQELPAPIRDVSMPSPAQQIHSSLVPLPMPAPHPLARAALPTFYSQSAQAPRHSSSRSLSGSPAAKAPPVSQRNTCNTTWRHKPQPRTLLPLRPATPTPASDCPPARPLPIHALESCAGWEGDCPPPPTHKSVLLEE